MKNLSFSLMPLGGVGEIGSNMILIKSQHEDIIIDCGLLFPYEEAFDINYLIPDFETIDPERTKNIIITHGHEDHIGALGHLIRQFPHLVIHASPFTQELIKRKSEEFGIIFNFKTYRAGDTLTFADLVINPIHVNHSIPETHGLIIRDKEMRWGALYISDFKVDPISTQEKPMNLKEISSHLMMCEKSAYFIDSTNVLNEGKTTSEAELESDLKQVLERGNKRLFITMFASNIHRINTIAKLAQKAGRKLVVMGRSLKTYIEAASITGQTEFVSDMWSTPDQVKDYDGKMLILLSGCQGDFLSALRRFSYGEDSTFKPTPEDLVVFSSKVIPGNEKKIYRIYNKLTEFGAEIVTASDLLIHASGHPGQKDLNLLLRDFRPDYYFPIHGESYLLKKHAEFIKTTYPDMKTDIFYNYQAVNFKTDGSVKIVKHDVFEPRIIHGRNLEIERTQISQRRKLATQGVVFVSIEKKTQKVQITHLGLPLMAESKIETLKKNIIHQIKENLHSREDEYYRDQVRIMARQYFNAILGYKPVAEVHLV